MSRHALPEWAGTISLTENPGERCVIHTPIAFDVREAGYYRPRLSWATVVSCYVWPQPVDPPMTNMVQSGIGGADE